MRPRCRVPLLAVLVVLVAAPSPAAAQAAPSTGTSPASLAEAHFYEEPFAAAVQGGRLDLFDYWTARPVGLHFPAAGQLEIDWGQEAESCRLEATGSGAAYELALDCGGAPRQARWTWLEPGRARFELAGAAPRTLVALPGGFEAIAAEAEARYAQGHLPAVAGRYREAAGGELIVEADGKVRLGGTLLEARLLECLDLGAQAEHERPPRIACLHVQLDGQDEPLILGAGTVDGASALVEGLVPEDVHPDGRPFERKTGGRVYLREP